MILLIDLCYKKNSLSRYEFVDPIRDALGRSLPNDAGAGAPCEVMHFTEVDGDDLDAWDKIILCGTALKDDTYARDLSLFSWIADWERPILGICAGMQVIGSAFGGDILPQHAIGLQKVDLVAETELLGEPRQIEGYHLHNHGVSLPPGFVLVAGGPGQVEAFRHRDRPVYGILFHPEVRNRWILERFARTSGGGAGMVPGSRDP